MKSNFNKNENAYLLRWAKKIKAINIMGGKCCLCENDNIITLDFHHKDENKESNINAMRTLRWSIIEDELKECKLLCANCHQEEHCKSESRHNTHKRIFLEKMGFDGCMECGYWGRNFASIDFHHKDGNKSFSISDVINRNIFVSVEDVFVEMEKCDVICHNCHRLRHFDSDRFKKFESKIYEKINTYVEKPHKIDRDKVLNMYLKRKMRQCEIAKEIGCSKSTISMILR